MGWRYFGQKLGITIKVPNWWLTLYTVRQKRRHTIAGFNEHCGNRTSSFRDSNYNRCNQQTNCLHASGLTLTNQSTIKKYF